MAETIYLRVGTEDRISLGAFIQTLGNFLGVLKELDATIADNPRGSVTWEVSSLSKNSPAVVGVTPERRSSQIKDVSHLVEHQFLENAALLTEKSDRTKFFSDRALDRFERMALKTKTIGPIAVYLNGSGPKSEEVPITRKTLHNVQELTGVRYSAFGSIIGSLDAISVHKGNEFRVWDQATGKPVKCKFEPEIEPRIKDLLRQRVAVSGTIQSNSAGLPIRMDVEELELARAKELPTISEMSGLIEDFTGGRTLRQYFEETDDE